MVSHHLDSSLHQRNFLTRVHSCIADPPPLNLQFYKVIHIRNKGVDFLLRQSIVKRHSDACGWANTKSKISSMESPIPLPPTDLNDRTEKDLRIMGNIDQEWGVVCREEKFRKSRTYVP